LTFRIAVVAFTILIAGFPQSVKEPILRKFLPEDATLLKHLRINFDDRGEQVVMAYASETTPGIDTGVRILQPNANSRWAIAFEEKVDVINGGGASSAINIERVRASNGMEAVVVILQHSGAGTATEWHVLASINGTITKLDPESQKKKALKARAYEFQGYNGVKAKGDLIVETLAGYTRRQARCCPNRPPLEMSFRFTGRSIDLHAVRELPYERPSGSRGPLLRVSTQGFWAYGYEMTDGFLVLGGSESPAQHAVSTPPATVALRERLVKDKVLFDAEDHLIMAADYKFTSASVAASVMLARSADGREWRDARGRPAATRKSPKAH
jgi:uncharacterized protein DUF4357